VALAASVLVIAGLTAGGWTYLARQHTRRLIATSRLVTEALADAERFRGQAQQTSLGEPTKWSDALGAAKRAQGLLNQGEADDALRNRVALALADLESEQAAAEQRAVELVRDRKLLDELETIRVSRSEHWDSKRTDSQYAIAFRGSGSTWTHWIRRRPENCSHAGRNRWNWPPTWTTGHFDEARLEA
jgi:hypothetical protein